MRRAAQPALSARRAPLQLWRPHLERAPSPPSRAPLHTRSPRACLPSKYALRASRNDCPAGRRDASYDYMLVDELAYHSSRIVIPSGMDRASAVSARQRRGVGTTNRFVSSWFRPPEPAAADGKGGGAWQEASPQVAARDF